MTMGNGSSVVDGEQRTIPEGFQSTVPSDNYDDNDEPPSYEESTVAGSSSSASAGPSRLHILGATWGGVNVTADVRSMVALDKSKSFQVLKLNMHTVHLRLLPDPAPAIVKTLTVLYRYDSDAPGTVQLLNAPQFAPQITVKVTPSAAAAASESKLSCGLPRLFVGVIKTEKLWRDPEGKVEIIAVLYGTQRIETQSVLGELGQFLGGGPSGQRQQVRTTANFFQSTSPQTFVPLAKSWTVYFRLLQSQDPAKVRCVTGMQDGALEVPWMD